MSAPSSLATPVRVRVMIHAGEAFVTSRFQAGDFYVTPDLGVVESPDEVEAIDARCSRFDLHVVTHGPSGMTVPMYEWDAKERRFWKRGVRMSLVLARLYATQLAKGQPAVMFDEEMAWIVVRVVARQRSDAALLEFAKLRRRGPRAKEG
jgi:hypothetical protein